MKIVMGMIDQRKGRLDDVARSFSEALEIHPWISSIASMLLSIVHDKTTTTTTEVIKSNKSNSKNNKSNTKSNKSNTKSNTNT